jgi:signal transduction histidine kinase
MVVDESEEVGTQVAVQTVISDALSDPSLTLAVGDRDGAGYVDVYGEPLDVPEGERTRGVTRVTQSGRPIAALIHDPTLDTESELVEGVAATSLMLLENARLIEELRTSRARMIEATERERRRLERDLHDGAQQSLVALQITLEETRRVAASVPELAKQLDATQRYAESALAELRALVHGIYPEVLEALGRRLRCVRSCVPRRLPSGSSMWGSHARRRQSRLRSISARAKRSRTPPSTAGRVRARP